MIRIIICLLLVPGWSGAQSVDRLLAECQVKGSVTTLDPQTGHWSFTDSLDATRSSQPASTFKIINLLVALETGIITSADDTIRWPGHTDTVLYGYRPEIYHDMTVREAFRESAGWVFIELAKRIGRGQYQYYLHRSGYGNGDLSEKGDDFWNFGAFGVSPVQQVKFIERMLKYDLPFSRRNIDVLKDVMNQEDFSGGRIYHKTGWTRIAGQDIGWWVGYYTTSNRTVIFATRIQKSRSVRTDSFGDCRKTITRSFLSNLLQ